MNGMKNVSWGWTTRGINKAANESLFSSFVYFRCDWQVQMIWCFLLRRSNLITLVMFLNLLTNGRLFADLSQGQTNPAEHSDYEEERENCSYAALVCARTCFTVQIIIISASKDMRTGLKSSIDGEMHRWRTREHLQLAQQLLLIMREPLRMMSNFMLHLRKSFENNRPSETEGKETSPISDRVLPLNYGNWHLIDGRLCSVPVNWRLGEINKTSRNIRPY